MVYLLIVELYGPGEFEVLAAYSTREAADAALASLFDPTYHRIDEVPLDPQVVPDEKE